MYLYIYVTIMKYFRGNLLLSYMSPIWIGPKVLNYCDHIFKLEYWYYRSGIPPSIHFVFWGINWQKWISDFGPIFGKFEKGGYEIIKQDWKCFSVRDHEYNFTNEINDHKVNFWSYLHEHRIVVKRIYIVTFTMNNCTIS